MNPPTSEEISRSHSDIDHPTRSVPHHWIMGIRFHTLPMPEVVSLLKSAIEHKKPIQVSFANAQTVAMCWRDKTLRDVINRSTLTFPDGMSIVWGGRMLGLSIRHRIAGPDAMAELCRQAAHDGHRIFLLGTSVETLSALRRALERKFPGIQIVGTFSPPMAVRFTPEQTNAMLAAVNSSKPDILFVGLSFPKQERWIEENLQRIQAPVSLGVGAAFDFLSDRIPRAPEWLQKRGLEWLHRLSCEPRRLWRRYLWGNIIFLGLLAAERLRRRFGSSATKK